MNKPNYTGIARSSTAIVLSAWLLALSISLTSPFVSGSGAAPGNNDLQSGQKFEIVGELYAYGVINVGSGKLSIISVVPLHLSGPEIISRQLVPIGSILTIVDKEPKKRAFFVFPYPVRYIVQIDSINAPAGIPLVIALDRGIEGKSTPLNPLIFKPLLDQ